MVTLKDVVKENHGICFSGGFSDIGNNLAVRLQHMTFFFFLCLFAISWAAPLAYGVSQARGRIGAVATRLHQSHSNLGSELRLQPTPQLTARPDPQPTEQGQGSIPKPHGS